MAVHLHPALFRDLRSSAVPMLWMLVAVGCSRGEDTGYPGLSDTCVEASRSAVDNPAEPASDLDFAAASAVSRVIGRWKGTFEYDDGRAVPLHVTFTEPSSGTIAAVTQEANEGGPDTGPWSEGSSDLSCPSFYDIPLNGRFVLGDGSLSGTFDIALHASSQIAQGFTIRRDFTAMPGSLAPRTFDPADWDRTQLVIDATMADDAWTGFAAWQSFDARKAAQDRDGGLNHAAGQSTGIDEGIGNFAVTREGG
jgi:hypothetical protein